MVEGEQLMILAEPTRYRAGLTLYGDYIDFSSLHSTVYELADQIPLAGHFEEFMLGFAYELRKAYQGEREVKDFGDQGIDKVTYFGCKFLWPFYLVHVGMLRWAAAFNPTTKTIQANLFQLEAATEDALVKGDLKIGRDCVDWLSRFRGLPADYLLQFIEDICLDYVSIPRAGKDRFAMLPETLRSVSSYSKEYAAFQERLEQISKFQKCKPDDLVSRAEWPDFKW